MKTILVAGGGTGGHVFPALAVAAALRELADVNVVFVGSRRGLEVTAVPERGYTLELLDAEPMLGGGPARALRSALVAAKATRDSIRMIRRIRPDAVLSVGGYAAGPPALAAACGRVPLAILEPNSVLGLANRLLLPFAARSYLAWPEVSKSFRSDRVRVFGVPLRAGFEPQTYVPKGGVRRVLVLGGSQGAAKLNEAVPLAIARAAARVGPIRVVHQTGQGRETSVRAVYAKQGVAEALVVPFIENVSEEMTSSDLVIARAGAVTVAEIAAVGRASLLVPFPHSAGDHQGRNAMALATLGGTLCVRQEAADEVRLATEISLLFEHDDLRVRMARAAEKHGRPGAALDVARDLLSLAGTTSKPTREKNPMNGTTAHEPSTPNGVS